MKTSRLLPFIVAILALASVLGSLSKSQPGGSLLLNAYWILYVLATLPLLGLAAFVLLIVLVVLYLRGFSDSLGHGIARKMKKRKKNWALRLVVVIYAWAFAIVFLMMHCDGIVCNTASSSSAEQGVAKIVSGGSGSTPTLLQGSFPGLENMIPSGWFVPVFIGLLAVCSVTVARSLLVGFQQSRAESAEQIAMVHREAMVAVQDAIGIISKPGEADPRTRIINCYQRLIMAASNLGAGMPPHMTAREFENTIRRTLLVEGSAVGGLTILFEEARYSLHSITEEEAFAAQGYLAQIATSLTFPERPRPP